MDNNGDLLTEYRVFLEMFSFKIDELVQAAEERELPFRLNSGILLHSELEGECLEWTRRYLHNHDCPCGLIPQLCRTVYRNLSTSCRLNKYYLDDEENGGSNDEDEDSTDASSQDIEKAVVPSRSSKMDANKVLLEVVDETHKTIKAWQRCIPKLQIPTNRLQVSVHAIKNTRRKMEDRHVVLPDLNTLFDLKGTSNQSYFAVFDGHGGLEAAEYAATHLHCNLVSDLKQGHHPKEALKRAYKTTDEKFLEKAKRENLRSGTTGINVLINDNDMYVGWLGDSQAFLVRSGQPVRIMSPHRPDRQDERHRIESLGGCVLYIGTWRVNGSISVSRAIGDSPHKPFICSDADVTHLTLTGEEEYMVLACDGLWDVISPIKAAQIVYNHCKTSPGSLEDAAIGLVNAARENGSSDNISVIVIFFKSSLTTPQSIGKNELLVSNPNSSVEEGSGEKSETEQKNENTPNEKEKLKTSVAKNENSIKNKSHSTVNQILKNKSNNLDLVFDKNKIKSNADNEKFLKLNSFSDEKNTSTYNANCELEGEKISRVNSQGNIDPVLPRQTKKFRDSTNTSTILTRTRKLLRQILYRFLPFKEASTQESKT